MTPRTVRAECLKLAANRQALFWGFAAAPLIVLVTGILGALFIAGALPQARALFTPSLPAQAAQALGAAGNPILQLFYILAAATIFAGEYRWETWRYLVPRVQRARLVLGKFGAFLIFAAVSLGLLALAGIAAALFGALASGSRPAPSADPGAAALAVLIVYGVTLAQLAAVAALTALLCVLTRSLIAGLLTVFLFGLAQAMFVGVFGEVREDPRFIAALPALAAETGRRWAAFVAGDPDAATPYGSLALAMLLAWTGALLAAATALFQRQNLSQE